MSAVRILVVDDAPEIRLLLKRVLVAQGYEVLEAADGLGAWNACQATNGEIDLLLTDINMPGMGGVELAHRLTSSYPRIPVLYISGQCEKNEIQVQLLQKRFGFLSKPFLPQSLVNAVEQLLTLAKGPAKAASLTEGTQKQEVA